MGDNNFSSGGGGSGGGGSSSLDELADTYTAGGDIRLFALIQTLLGSFAALWFGAGIEVLSVFVGIHVWIIDGIGRFLEAVITEALGTTAGFQSAAWTEAARSLEHEPMLIPFVLAVEALAIYALVAAVRDRGVVP